MSENELFCLSLAFKDGSIKNIDGISDFQKDDRFLWIYHKIQINDNETIYVNDYFNFDEVKSYCLSKTVRKDNE
ncbi:hypothetical protein H7198_01755 [Fructobacillus sp. CRL 2054]|uniref:hypothetical protein n=1 Tax=Fructobacillus sp. CRL 2054 TaxID=2763007 RepID=UPI002377EF9E|nr:hypothetical protein [Fructobacillus sp. CRL 2054]MDD9138338.1 hypothetical protein [Fructobacillus sp. CRL 2054]